MRGPSSWIRRCVGRAAAGSILLVCATAVAQVDTATHTVRTTTGDDLELSGVEVVAVKSETGLRRTATTDARGTARLLGLPPGSYRVEARIEGFAPVRAFRERVRHGGDDSEKVTRYEEMGVDLLRGEGRIDGPGRVRVDGRPVRAGRIVVATGSVTPAPPIEGIAECGFWTHREIAALEEVPASAAVIGGGPVGLEVAQQLRRLGSQVVLVDSSSRLLEDEEPELGDLLSRRLREEGIDLRLGIHADAARPAAGGYELDLAGGTVAVERIVLATGRVPAVEGIGLETVGVDVSGGAVTIDATCRVADGVWAVGDVTGAGLFTHVASYQGRIAAADILGEPVPADHTAIPRSVFTDPEVAAVGVAGAEARARGLDTVRGLARLEDMERATTYGDGAEGVAGLRARRSDGVVVGAFGAGPLASEWIHMGVIAVKAGITAATLADTIAQFPTFAEGLVTAARRIEAERAG